MTKMINIYELDLNEIEKINGGFACGGVCTQVASLAVSALIGSGDLFGKIR